MDLLSSPSRSTAFLRIPFVDLIAACSTRRSGYPARSGAIHREAHWTPIYKLIERAQCGRFGDLSIRLLGQLVQVRVPRPNWSILIIDDTVAGARSAGKKAGRPSDQSTTTSRKAN